MTVNYSALESKYGFKGTNFSVDATGALIATSISVESITLDGTLLDLGSFIFAGSSIDTVNNVEIRFLPDSVSFAGNVTALTYIGGGLINNLGSVELDSATRVVIKNSPLQVYSLTEINRNLLTPEGGDIVYNSTTNDINYYAGDGITGQWRSLSTGDITFSDATISAGPAQVITIESQAGGGIELSGDTITISGTNVDLVGTVAMDNLEISTPPTQDNHATRKDYVDAKISAFAIAFGA